MTLIINPKYSELSTSLLNIDKLFAESNLTIKGRDNSIRLINIQGVHLCVKHYDTPSWRNRIAVKIYKSSKGKKAYYNAALLRERGFMIQEPVAYISYRTSLMKQSMYFIGIHTNYRHTLSDLYKYRREDRESIIKAFARYSSLLHYHGFSYKAHFTDNILFEKINDQYKFAILDTYGLKFGKRVKVEKGCRNLTLLTDDKNILEEIIKAYATIRETNVDYCLSLI